MAVRTVIVGTGCAIPRQRVSNADMLSREFWGPDGRKIDKPNQQIIDQFEAITGIKERRYAEENQVASDLAAAAATDALDSSGVDPETLDQLKVVETIKEGETVFALTEEKKKQGNLMLKPDSTGRYAFSEFLRQAAIEHEFRQLPPKQQTPFARTILASGQHDGTCIGPVLAEWIAAFGGAEQ